MRKNEVFDRNGNLVSSVIVPYTKEELQAHNEYRREDLINNGEVTFNNITVGTDSRTIQWFQGLMFPATANSEYVFSGFNAKSGTTDLTASDIIGLFNAGVSFVAGKFNTYNSVESDIEDGTITDTGAIDEEYA